MPTHPYKPLVEGSAHMLIRKGAYANVASTLALVVALGGVSYAAVAIPKDSVGSKQIINSSVKSKDVKNGSIKSADLATGAVTSGNIKDGQVTAGDLGADAVTSGNIKDGQIAAGDLGADAVTSGNIKDGQIAAADLGADAVTSAKVKDGSLTRADIGGALTRAYVTRDTSASFTNLPLSTSTTLRDLDLPPGSYVVTAKFLANSNNGTKFSLACTLAGSDQTEDFADGLTLGDQAGDDREIVSMLITPTFATSGQVTLSCNPGTASMNVGKAAITAIQVDEVINQP